MAVVTDLIHQSVDDKPSEFATTFDELIKDRVAAAVAGKKVELAQRLFGNPELDDEPEEETPIEDEPENGDEETPTSSD